MTAESSPITEVSSVTNPDGWTSLIFRSSDTPPKFVSIVFSAERSTMFGNGPLDEEQIELIRGGREPLSEEESDVLQETRFGYEVDGLDLTIRGDFPGGLEHAARLAAALLLGVGAKETP